jgi:transposase
MAHATRLLDIDPALAAEQAREILNAVPNHPPALLLKNRNSLRPGEDVELEELLAANHSLFVLYVLRDALKGLWHYRHRGYAARAWQSWYRKALRSRIEPLVRFARLMKPYLPGILAHCRWPLGTNLVEGINN